MSTDATGTLKKNDSGGLRFTEMTDFVDAEGKVIDVPVEGLEDVKLQPRDEKYRASSESLRSANRDFHKAAVDAAEKIKPAEGNNLFEDWEKTRKDTHVQRQSLMVQHSIDKLEDFKAEHHSPEYTTALEAEDKAYEAWQKFKDTEPSINDAREKARSAKEANLRERLRMRTAQHAYLKDTSNLNGIEGDADEIKKAADTYAERIEGEIKGLTEKGGKGAGAEGVISDARAAELNSKGFWPRNLGAIKENMWSEKAWEGWGKGRVAVRGAGALVGGYQAVKGIGQAASRDEETGESQAFSGLVRTAIGGAVALAALRGFTGKVKFGSIVKSTEGHAHSPNCSH